MSAAVCDSPRSVGPTAAADKLLKSLDCLLMERFAVQDKTLLEKLLTSLHGSDALLKTIPVATHSEWFSSVLDVYRRQTRISKNSSAHVLYAFALKYLAVLVKSDDRLCALIETRTVPSMIGCVDVQSNLKEPAVFNAYLSLLQTLNTSERGLEYVFQEGLWKHILFAINGLIVPAKYVEIQSSQYIADLIYKSIKCEIPQFRWEPLVKALFCKLNSTNSLIDRPDVKEFFAYNVCMKTLILLLEKCIGTKHESDVCRSLVEKYALSDLLVNIHKLLSVAPVLLKNYMTLYLLSDCLTNWHHSDTECILKSIFSLMNVSKNAQSYRQINNLNIQAIRYANISNNTHLTNCAIFEKELIIRQLTPLKKCTQYLKSSKYEQIQFDNINSDSGSKCILNHNDEYNPIINEVAISSILNIIDIVPSLKQGTLDYLVEFFSILTDQFLLSDYWLQPYQNQNSILHKFSEILSYIFICWSKVFEHKLIYNVPHNSIMVPLVHSHCEFFHKFSHTSTLLQNGLKLISTTLNKRIYESVSCDDNLRAFDKLFTSLINLLLDPRPEIRDSCLQCISSIIVAFNYDSEMGRICIKLISEKNLSVAVLNTLKHDNDPFVRAKALECLENMVSVSSIWETSLKDSDLMDHCLRLMQYESEGIIRRQIVKLITALFIHNELNDELCSEIYIIMVHISVKDPLWEVKTFTYEFWDFVVKKFITKPYKLNDIATLNENLIKLSTTGCIHVLYVALKEEYDLVVQKKAICLTKELLASINSFNNVPYPDFKLKNVPLNCLNSMNDNLEHFMGSIHKKSRHVDSEDRILNSITTISDCDLLPSLKSANNSNIYPSDICFRQKTDDYTSVNEFLKFTSTYDFEECDAKTQWVISTRSGLNSMLDDIIGQSQNCFIEGADLVDCH